MKLIRKIKSYFLNLLWRSRIAQLIASNSPIERPQSITVKLGKFDKPSADGCIIKSSAVEDYIKTHKLPTDYIGTITHASEE